VLAPVRDTLLRLAEGPELYRPLWSAEIMVEMRRTLCGKFGIAPNRIAHLEAKLREHFPEAWIKGIEPLLPSMTNDAKDRHVLAAAAHAKAGMLVTYNLKHFPLSSTKPWRVTPVGPSQLLKKLYASDPEATGTEGSTGTIAINSCGMLLASVSRSPEVRPSPGFTYNFASLSERGSQFLIACRAPSPKP
jgi:predicted nucleic acid-binding protein